jgi:hypothetical protein
MARTAERRPAGRAGVPDDDRTAGITARITRARASCPLVRAAAALGDPAVIAAVEYWHPPFLCPAVRGERAA